MGSGKRTASYNICTTDHVYDAGYTRFVYLVDPFSAIGDQVQNYGGALSSSFDNNDLAAAQGAAQGTDVAIVFINANSGEGQDRDLEAELNGSPVSKSRGPRFWCIRSHDSLDQLVRAVASVHPNVVVVVHTVGPLIVESWIENPNVTAV